MSDNNSRNYIISLFAFVSIIGLVLIVVITNYLGIGEGRHILTQSPSPDIAQMDSPIQDTTLTISAIISYKESGQATQLAATRTPVTPIYLPTGIYNDQRVEISAALLFIDAQNAWGGFIDGNRFTLYAGSLQSDPDQGVVFIVSNLPDGTKFEQYLTRSKHGALHVASEQNNRLTLLAADGETFYFDIPARVFVSSLTEVVPTATPTPTSPRYTPEIGVPSPTYNPYPVPAVLSTEVP